MALTKEKLLELQTAATARFNEAMKARQPADYTAFVTEDTCGEAGYSPFLLGGIGKGRKWIGNRVYSRLKSYGVRFSLEKFEKTVAIEADEFADNPAVDGAKIADKLVEAYSLTDAYEVYGVLRENKTGFDMDPLFGTHEYVALGADGKPTLTNGQPTVLGSYTNDVVPAQGQPAVAPYYLLSKNSVLKVTRTGEAPSIVMKGGTADSSEHTFDYDELVWGWRTRVIYRPGLAFYSIRCTKPLTETVYQELKDRMRTFSNDAGIPVNNAPTVLVVRAGSQAAAAARKIFGQQFLANGESNIYATEKIQVIEADEWLFQEGLE